MGRHEKRNHPLPKRMRASGGTVPASCPSGKRSYLDRQHAVRAARSAQGKHGTGPLLVYKCLNLPKGVTGDPCGQYHMTSQRKAPWKSRLNEARLADEEAQA